MRPALLRRAALVAAAAALASACGRVVVLEAGDPITFVQQPQTSRVLASSGEVLASLHADQDREDVSLERVPDELVAAVVAVEDRRFFLHRGVDVPAIARAAVRNLDAGTVQQGGSTITQQYVKNTMLGPVRTMERKLKEAALAYQLEQRYTKREILERYLNTIYFGQGAYGVHAAAVRYFGQPVERLRLHESALLAGLIASPATYDPYERPDAAVDRRRTVLDAMVATGQLSSTRAATARAAPLDVAPLPAAERFTAPYAVEEVKRLVRHDPAFVALGDTPDERLAALFTSGLRVYTTIDLRLQAQAEAAVGKVLSKPGDPAAAVVAIEPASGAVRALVGGRDFYDLRDPHARFNLATQGRRQAGSAFKPIVLATALRRGISLERVFPGGSAVEITSPRCRGPDGPWRASNYDRRRYGTMTLREATVWSVNTVYARLAAELGPTAIVATARDLGVRGGLEAVCAIALGAEEVSPLDLAAGYVPFANLGRQHPRYLIERIETAGGRVVYQHQAESFQAVEQAVAYLVTQTLEEVVRRGTGVRASIGRPQAGKTGTSDDSSDAWFVGYTPDLVAAVWVGFPSGQVPMVPPRTRVRVEGGRWPAEIWAAFASRALDGVEPRPFAIPEVDLVTVEVDVSRNCRPNPYTPPELVAPRRFLKGTEPRQLCKEPTGPPDDAVPAVVGLTREVAVRLLASKGFEVALRPVASALYPPGYVTAQEPAAGGRARAGRVLVWVAVHSRQKAVVPAVVGLPVEQARARLEAAGWVPAVVVGCPAAGCPPDARAGRVYAQDPVGGEWAEPHSIVTARVYP